MKKLLVAVGVCVLVISLNAEGVKKEQKDNSFETVKANILTELNGISSCIKKTKNFKEIKDCRTEAKKRKKSKKIERLEKKLAKLKKED